MKASKNQVNYLSVSTSQHFIQYEVPKSSGIMALFTAALW